MTLLIKSGVLADQTLLIKFFEHKEKFKKIILKDTFFLKCY